MVGDGATCSMTVLERRWLLLGKFFLGKQIRAVKGAPMWMLGEDIETSR